MVFVKLLSYLYLYSAITAVALCISGSFATLFPFLAASPHERTEAVKNKFDRNLNFIHQCWESDPSSRNTKTMEKKNRN